VRIKIRYFAYLADLVERKEEEMYLEGEWTIRKILGKIVEEKPILRRIELDSEGPIIILLNGKPANMNLKVSDGDIITLIPPASGG